MTTNREIRILADANNIAQTAAAEFLDAARDAVREKDSFAVALAGGSTPKALYGLLVNNPLLQQRCLGARSNSSSETSATYLPTMQRATSVWPAKRCLAKLR